MAVSNVSIILPAVPMKALISFPLKTLMFELVSYCMAEGEQQFVVEKITNEAR